MYLRLLARPIAPLIAAAALLLLPFAAGAAEVPERWKRAWPQTDFSRIEVDPAEIFSGGPPKDGIPAITGPEMIAAGEEDGLDAREPVMVLELDGQPARAYPVRYLIFPEIVNDEAGGIPIAVTFCPLCNSGLIFDRRLGGRVLEFGVSGMLRFSDMVMFDRQTDSLWNQLTGKPALGPLVGQGIELVRLPIVRTTWANWLAQHPDTTVLSLDTGWTRDYEPGAAYGDDFDSPTTMFPVFQRSQQLRTVGLVV